MTATKAKKKPKGLKQMTPAQRRVAIAKDVLKHLNGGARVRRGGSYCYIESNNMPAIPEQGDMRKYLRKIDTPKCQVCAKGAMMIAHVRLFDNFDLSAGVHADERYDNVKWFSLDPASIMASLTEDGFTWKDLNNIESCFEDGYCYCDIGDYDVCYVKLPSSGPARLRVLMQNIVDNAGAFRPDLLPRATNA